MWKKHVNNVKEKYRTYWRRGTYMVHTPSVKKSTIYEDVTQPNNIRMYHILELFFYRESMYLEYDREDQNQFIFFWEYDGEDSPLDNARRRKCQKKRLDMLFTSTSCFFYFCCASNQTHSCQTNNQSGHILYAAYMGRQLGPRECARAHLPVVVLPGCPKTLALCSGSVNSNVLALSKQRSAQTL